jgi:Leucine-rich repeat (LRR) protein
LNAWKGTLNSEQKGENRITTLAACIRDNYVRVIGGSCMPLPFERPNAQYMMELRDVAAKAAALSDYLGKETNVPLPDQFPKEPIQTLCLGLIGLPDGTAEGSITPLMQAHARLPSWRTDYLQFDDIETQIDRDAAPIARRGDYLDKQMNELYSAVGSAIEVYKRLSGTEFKSNIEPELIAPPDAEFGRKSSLDAVAKIEMASAQAAKEIAKLSLPESDQNDKVERLVQDANNQAVAGRAELSLPSPRPNLLENAASGFDKTARAFDDWALFADVSSKALGKIGDGVIDGLVAWAKDCLHSLLLPLRETGPFLRKSARALREASGELVGGKAPPFDLDEVHAMILRGEAPPEAWVPFIEELTFGNASELSDLTPVQNLKNLRSLIATNNQVTTIKALGNCHKLVHLQIQNSLVSDLSPLKDVRSLKQLFAFNNPIQSLVGLEDLKNLESLYIGSTFVSDLSPLEDLTELVELYLEGTQVTDLLPLARLNKLRVLNIVGTQVNTVSPLDHLTNLGLQILWHGTV